jgi:hypothetical protein
MLSKSHAWEGQHATVHFTGCFAGYRGDAR